RHMSYRKLSGNGVAAPEEGGGQQQDIGLGVHARFPGQSRRPEGNSASVAARKSKWRQEIPAAGPWSAKEGSHPAARGAIEPHLDTISMGGFPEGRISWRMWLSSARSGATKARERSLTGFRSAPTWWCASRAGTMLAIRW